MLDGLKVAECRVKELRWGRMDQKNTVYERVWRSLSSSMMADGQSSREGQAGGGFKLPFREAALPAIPV